MAYKGAFLVTASCLVFLLFVGLASSYSLTPTPENLESFSHTHGAEELMGWPGALQEQATDFLCPATCPACTACPACPSAPSCPLPVPPGYKHYPNVGYYKVHYELVNWTRARGLCEAEGGHLLIINSQEEADLTSGLMEQYGFTSYYHVGFYDVTGLQTFVTIFDDLLSASGYYTWAPGEPNGPGTSLCGAFGPNRGLDDIQCQSARPFVCELLT